MKMNVMKRIAAFVLAGIMALGTSVSTFAAEPEVAGEVSDETCVAEYTIDVGSNSIMPLYDNEPVGGTIQSNKSDVYYPKLSSYVGLSKTFYAGTSSSGSAGMVLLYLYNKNNKLISNDWILGVNDYGSWSFTLPSSGTYTLKVFLQGTTAPVNIAASWEG